ncbi:hypothetical protein MC885_017937 [Smutsia gigantea]|nr:hypothetical protein MC885_017937 [Smutsia gigantea]
MPFLPEARAAGRAVALALALLFPTGPAGALLSLQPNMPHVCAAQELTVVGRRQPCVQAFSRTVPLWKPGCGRQAWCVGHERRTVYYVGYRQVYAVEAQTVLRCCPGWSQQPGDQGCFSREYWAPPTRLPAPRRRPCLAGMRPGGGGSQAPLCAWWDSSLCA